LVGTWVDKPQSVLLTYVIDNFPLGAVDVEDLNIAHEFVVVLLSNRLASKGKDVLIIEETDSKTLTGMIHWR